MMRGQPWKRRGSGAYLERAKWYRRRLMRWTGTGQKQRIVATLNRLWGVSRARVKIEE